MYNIDTIRPCETPGIGSLCFKMLSFFHHSWFLTTSSRRFTCNRCMAKDDDIRIKTLWSCMMRLSMTRLNMRQSISPLILKCCNFLPSSPYFTTFNVVFFSDIFKIYNIASFLKKKQVSTISCEGLSDCSGSNLRAVPPMAHTSCMRFSQLWSLSLELRVPSFELWALHLDKTKP